MFTPRHIKHSRLLLRHARKYLRYKDDRLSTSDREQILAEMSNLREALRDRDREKIHSAADTLDKSLHRLTPVTWESHWRENCEVILVAVVVAVGIRSYFLQPFKIPTGSMQPTLNGIVGHPSTEAPPAAQPKPFMYCWTSAAVSPFDPLRASPSPSRIDFLPSSIVSFGMSDNCVWTTNSATRAVSFSTFGKLACLQG